MIYDTDRLLLIAGPCSLESIDIARSVASKLADIRDRNPDLNIVFKGSFDKANRTSVSSDRGVGLEQGLAIFESIKGEFGFPCITDIHLPDQASVVSEVCDVLQIPAFLCRQTDLLLAAAESGSVVNVKKGQFLSPYEMSFVADKLRSAGAKEIWLTDRGSCFGYQNLVVDMRNYPIMSEYSRPVICDATHAVQLPGAAGGRSGGQREFIEPIAKAALAAGASGVFLETHPDPSSAISDAASQVPLNELDGLLERCLKIWKAVR